MIPYASRHGRRYRMRRFFPAAGGPRFAFTEFSGRGLKGARFHSRAGSAIAQTRHLRLMAVAARLRPLPPMVGERPWALPPRMGGRL